MVTFSGDKTTVAVLTGLYLAFLFGIAFYYYKKNKDGKEATIESHYLGNRGMNAVVLVMTMFATIFSGYTVVGVPNEAYRKGFEVLKYPIVFGGMNYFGQVIFFPRLRQLASSRKYLSPTDFVQDRFRSSTLTNLIVFVVFAPSWMYFLAQFAALGKTAEALFDGKIDGWVAATILSAVMFIYETLGGLNSVALTDVVQGGVMMVGSLAICLSVPSVFGSFGTAMEALSLKPDAQELFQPLSFESVFTQWAFILSFISFALYPTYLMRVYAADSLKSLRLNCMLLPLSPLLTNTPGLLLGLYGRGVFQGLGSAAAFGTIMNYLLTFGGAVAFFVSLQMTGALAAIMSTADSYLIACSNIFSLDVYRRLRPNTPEKNLLLAGKAFGLFITVLAVAVTAAKFSLDDLITFQGAILMQLFPAFILGLYTRVDGKAILVGLCTGLVVLIVVQSLVLAKYKTGIPSSIWSTLANLFVVCCSWLPRRSSTSAPSQQEGATMQGDFRSLPILTKQGIDQLMVGIDEPIFVAKKLFAAQIILLILMGPWFFIGADAKPIAGTGFPPWALYQLIVYICFGLNSSALAYYWRGNEEKQRLDSVHL